MLTPKSKWSCVKCTYDNIHIHLQCFICGHTRNFSFQESKLRDSLLSKTEGFTTKHSLCKGQRSNRKQKNKYPNYTKTSKHTTDEHENLYKSTIVTKSEMASVWNHGFKELCVKQIIIGILFLICEYSVVFDLYFVHYLL